VRSRPATWLMEMAKSVPARQIRETFSTRLAPARMTFVGSRASKRSSKNRDEEDREDHGYADELDGDHVELYHRVGPRGVSPIAGGGQGFCGPLEANEQRPRLALLVLHPGLVEDRQDEEGHRQCQDKN